MKGLTAAVGVFDGVHLGHRALVAEVCRRADATDTVPAIFTFTAHPLHTINPAKAPRTLTPAHAKEELLKKAGAGIVHTIDFSDRVRNMSARDFMGMLQHDYNVTTLVIGFNHRFGHGREHGFSDYVRIGAELGMQVVRADEEVIDGADKPVSSSTIRSYITAGKIKEANTMLGRPYAITGTVEKGQQIGRTIGFPTANLQPLCESQLIPAAGVYACMATIGNEAWPAMVNIGRRPTVGDDLNLTIEANIINFEGDLYGKPLTLEFIERLRDEKKFDDFEHLQRQLQHDRNSTLALINK